MAPLYEAKKIRICYPGWHRLARGITTAGASEFRDLCTLPLPFAMPRPRPLVFGLYAWSPEYGYRYLHPANRRSFELLEPVGKVFEKVSDLDDDSDWITLRYDEQQFLVRGELFKELYNKPPFGFGDLVEEVRPTPGQPAHRGLISDIYWSESQDRATFQLVERKRKLARIFEPQELRRAE